MGRVEQSDFDWIGEHLCVCPSCLNRVETFESRLDDWQRHGVVRTQDAVAAIKKAGFDESDWPLNWRQFLNEKELNQLRENASHMIPLESSPVGIATSTPSDNSLATVTTGEKRQGNTNYIGEYLLVRQLGQGAFSCVYLAEHRVTGRRVALKVPRDDKYFAADELDRYLDEAKKLSMLRHSTIVPIVDWGQWNQNQCFVASDWIDGLNLRERIQDGNTDREQLLSILHQIADGLQHVHERGLVHRDVKPDNILIDRGGKAYLVDFGLAICDNQQWQLRGQLAGTRPYMSPEQIRGETHRLDGRTDIWSMGVILYELLTGQRPFRGYKTSQVLEEIEKRDPKPLRQIDESIPAELERICMKCLQKRMSDRYVTAADLSADLNRYINAKQNQIAERSIKQLDEVSQTLCPPGVRSFEMSDADVFCALMPGLRRADGVPETVQFFTDKLAARERDVTFPIGVIYGPSGCGKSSFVKAGILPRLDSSTLVVVLEATKHDFETRLRDGLHASISKTLPSCECYHQPLPELFDRIRRCLGQQGQKLVVIVDQMEQWLSTWDGTPATPLVSALRHCDGGALQSLLIVRDDFWLATSRLMQSLEQPLIDGENVLFIDLFLSRHAERVLQGFGRAYHALPAYPIPICENQRNFLRQVIEGLSNNGRVAPVQVAFVAEVLKDEIWEPRTLELLGGIEGIGVRFLERTFTLPTAPAVHRCHAEAVQAVLRLLLPTPRSNEGAMLKGQSRSEKELSHACSIPIESTEFQDLIHLLEAKTKLITVVDPIGREESCAAQQGRFYQLAHDYLVPSLQEWLARTEALTWRGRTRQLMQRLDDMWSNYEDTRHLPRMIEWLQIRTLIPISEWTISQARMMRRAQQRIFQKSAMAIFLVLLLGYFLWQYRGSVKASILSDSLLHASSEDVSPLIKELDSWHRWSQPKLTEVLASATIDGDLKAQRRALMALVRREPGYATRLLQHYRSAPLDELAPMTAALSHVPDAQCALEQLWQDFKNPEMPSSVRIRAAMFLAQRPPKDAPKDADWQPMASELTTLLLAQPPAEQKQWAVLAQPIAHYLLPHLAKKIVECPDGTTLRIPASLYSELAQRTDSGNQPIIELFNSAMAADSERSLQQSKGAAAAAAALANHGDWTGVDAIFRRTEDPTLRSYLIEYLVGSVANFDSLVEQLESSSEPNSQYGLILTIGDAGKSQPPRARSRVVNALLKIWQSSNSSGVRHSISWALREWGVPSTELPKPLADSTKTVSLSATSWKSLGANGSLGDFSIISTKRSRPLEAPMVCFSTGNISRIDELGREVRLSIPRPFAIATTEVTVDDFLRFHKDHKWDERKSPTFDCPVNRVTWFDAVDYCNWLSKECGIPEAEWCYLPNESGKYAAGMRIPDNVLERQGFRLPTAAEWEFACRGSARSAWSFGNDSKLAPQYAWFQSNAGLGAHSVGELKPNEHGLFDMHGNVWEWCQDQLTSNEFRDPFRLGDRRLCGGTFLNDPRELRFNAQNWNPPDKMTDADGFRICRTLPTR